MRPARNRRGDERVARLDRRAYMLAMFFKVLARGCRLVLGLALLAAANIWAAPSAWADCTDPPMAGVDWRRCFHDGREFVGADLRKAQLRDASFTRADLTKANFAEADAFRAKFYSANMAGAAFDRARIAEADFTEANLTGASFRNADLRGAKLIAADMRGADFTGANLRSADLFRARLGGALWTDGKTRCADASIGQCN